MNRHIILAAFFASAMAGSASGESSKEIAGTWQLVSSVVERDGTKIDQFGTDPKGMLSLSPDGHFMLTIIAAGLPKFASGNRANGTTEENKAVVSKSIAMIGTYAVDAAAKTITWRTESATFPNWDGTEQKRLIATLNGEELRYVTPNASSGGVGTVTWRRVK
jgi:hypothetical protein